MGGFSQQLRDIRPSRWGVKYLIIFYLFYHPIFFIFIQLNLDNMEDLNFWKERAIARRLENKELNKRRKELTLSRENWKEKYMKQKIRGDKLEHELGLIKKKLNDILS